MCSDRERAWLRTLQYFFVLFRPQHFADPVVGAESQAEYLKAAGVGHERLIPAHVLVEAAGLFDELFTRRNVQVERVAYQYLRAHIFYLARIECAYRRARRDRNECWCLYIAVRCVYHAQPCAAPLGFLQYLERKHRRSILEIPAHATKRNPRLSRG